MNFLRYPVLIAVITVLSGCATHFDPDNASDPYGFFTGFWHGCIFIFALVGNLISWLLSLFGFEILSSVQIIGRPNTGFWYYVGFFLGLSAAGGGAKR